MAKVAVMGFGTVGSGVWEIIKAKNFEKAAGEDIDVKYILDIRDFDEPEVWVGFTRNMNLQKAF